MTTGHPFHDVLSSGALCIYVKPFTSVRQCLHVYTSQPLRPDIHELEYFCPVMMNSMLARTLFASTLRRTSCNAKPQRGVTRVASRFNGWYIAARKKRAFRYATSNPCRVPTARYLSTSSIPAIEMAGYHCQMPTASLAKLELEYFCPVMMNSKC